MQNLRKAQEDSRAQGIDEVEVLKGARGTELPRSLPTLGRQVTPQTAQGRKCQDSQGK